MKQVVAHKAFPLVVALWFAALIGLGSLVVPTALIERIVVALGLPTFLSAAAPPLGTTAKLAIALAGTVFGAVLGLLLGRALYRSTRDADHGVAPINAHEELGAEGLDGTVDAPQEDLVLTEAAEELAEEEEPVSLDPQVDEDEDEAWNLTWLEEEAPLETEAVAPEIDEEPMAEEPQEEEPAPEPLASEADEAEPLDEMLPPVSFAPGIPQTEEHKARPEFDDLTLMQLAQRLQTAMTAHRAMRAAQPAAPALEETAQDSAPAPLAAIDEEAPAEIAQEPEVQREERAEPGEDPSASTVHHPAHKPFLETDELVEGDEDEPEDETALGETFSSLLAMTASVRAEPEEQREQEPADTPVPPKSETAPEQTLAALDRVGQAETPRRAIDPQEQALRDALLNLHQFNQNS